MSILPFDSLSDADSGHAHRGRERIVAELRHGVLRVYAADLVRGGGVWG